MLKCCKNFFKLATAISVSGFLALTLAGCNVKNYERMEDDNPKDIEEFYDYDLNFQ